MQTNPLPGDFSTDEEIKRIIRVDHAGEYGAMRIYAGQPAVLKGRPSEKIIEHMAQQEAEHLAAFEKLMREKRVRPTALMPLWHVAGYALGAVTAMLGERAAMACTVAVESVIDEHYAGQEKRLENDAPELQKTIAKFRADEREHHDTGLANGAEDALGYGALTAAIRGVTRMAIWLSIRI